MRSLRDVFYINNYPEKKYAIYHGLSFNEFMNCESNKIINLLLLNNKFKNWFDYDINPHTELVFIDQKRMREFLTEDHYDFGDFAWIDYKESDKLENLSSQEIAELLYLGHKANPVGSPFFDNLENRYVYLAHDDGWYCKLYYKHKDDMKEIFENKIVQTISAKFKRRKIYPMSEEVKEQLYNLSNNGFVVNFNCITAEKEIQLKFYNIGEFLDMDDMYNDLNRHINNAKKHGRLTYNNKQWRIEVDK